LRAQLPNSAALRLDITDEAAVNEAIGGMPSVEILINNAGIGHVGNIEETGKEDFERLLRVNVEGMYLVTRAAMPKLLAAKGCIVNIGSVAGLIGVKRRLAYCATKGAVVALTRQLAVDLRGPAPRQLHLSRDRAHILRGSVSGKISQTREGQSARRITPASAGGPPGTAGRDRALGALLVFGGSGFRHGGDSHHKTGAGRRHEAGLRGCASNWTIN
jgi:hypothetical protein